MILHHLLQDPVLIVLLIASFISWVIIVDRCIALYGVKKADAAFLRGDRSGMSPLCAFEEALRRYSGTNQEQLLVILDTRIAQQRERLERALPLLGVIGSTAAYAGLLGTVIGIIQSFQSIQAHNNMSPAVVSGGISSALIATAVGLGVAIPAVAAHHLLCSAITKRVARWEASVALWLPEMKEEHGNESLPLV